MKNSLTWFIGIFLGAAVVGAAYHFWKPWPESTPVARPTPRKLPQIQNTTADLKPESSTPLAPDPTVVKQKIEREYAAALALKTEGKPVEARDALRKFLTDHASSDRIGDVKTLLGEINITLLTTKAAAPEKVEHVVGAGETLGKIAAQYNSPVALIVKSNGLRDNTARLGDRLWIPRAKFSVLVEKSKFTLTLSDVGQFFKEYKVGLGAANSTPVGEFVVTDRIANPTWWRDDGKEIPYGHPENILGTHWLALNLSHYGIHGTWDKESIGKDSSRGCVRLTNTDIEELFTILPRQTPVKIVE